ncbi:MAG TPA: 3-phosphoglycerate dehydrogenase family protein [Fimbriimonas sp.]|nr:3-phosphoglycerate dehydrogenase family protein [Fimbriimonas sp.]
MRVLVADKFEDSGLTGLRALGAEVDYRPELSGDSLQAHLSENPPDVLVVRSTQVTAPMLGGESSLALIIRAGAGTNNIDTNAASARGILVTNCPGKNSYAVAELAFGLILACDRHIPDNVFSLHEGKWDKKRFSKARGLYGRTLGLVGLGKIGQEMIPRGRAFGMNVVGFARWLTPDVAAALNIGRAESPLEVAEMSDVVSVHVALTPETKGILGKEFFGKLREGAIFVNTSRAEVVDQAALEEVLRSGKITAGLDVFDGEPSSAQADYSGSMRDMPNVYCTHHIGASTDQAQEAVASEVVRIAKEFMLGGTAPNVVNIKRAEIATHLLVVRHIDRVGVLAGVLSQLKKESVNVQEMENIVLGGAKAAIAQIALDKEPTKELIQRIKMDSSVFDASVFAIQR